MEEKIIHITSGRGPAECCRVVAMVQQMIMQEAGKEGLNITVLDSCKGDINRTLQSTSLHVKGKQLNAFLAGWRGSVQWIARSPYRKLHKRKNWFVGVEVFDVPAAGSWDLAEVRFETCRASGPGGQNVNKVETAVRGTHLPSGIQVLAMDTRSQLQNRKLCIERLQEKVRAWHSGQLIPIEQSQWQEHNSLERGNPVKVIRKVLSL